MLADRSWHAIAHSTWHASGRFATIAAVRVPIVLLLAVLSSGCGVLPANRLTLPHRNTLVRDQLVIHSDFSLAADHRLFEELTSQRADLCRRLALPSSDEPIHVYLFETAERFEGFMRLHYPDFPARRAFFVETDARLLVYAQWGDRMADDLRHEVTHGYLHATVPDIPQWLDEAIAKYYEVPRAERGLNREMLERFLSKVDTNHWEPNLQRLEQMPATRPMDQDDYAEAWAWGHLLMQSRPECLGVLRGYLADVRQGNASVPISARIATFLPDANAAVVEHVRSHAGRK